MIQKKIMFTYDGDYASYVHMNENEKIETNSKAINRVLISPDHTEGQENLKGDIVIDLDLEGRVLGIEILGNDMVPKGLQK